MSDPEQTADQELAGLGDALKQQICCLVDSLVAKDEERYESDFVLLLARVQELVDRKQRCEGTKTDTRDLLGELLFSRLRRGMRLFLQSEDEVAELRAAEWVMGALFSITTLSEFAQAFDQALIKNSGASRDFSFAGRTDFISVEEVMQMLSSGKHVGCLTLEKADNRLDIYLKDGRVVFLDSHHVVRRVMPGGDAMRHREIPEAAVTAAESARAKTGKPALLALFEAGHFKKDELREVMRLFGKEVLFDFMRERDTYAFFYRRLDQLPDYCEQHDLRLGVTSMLLEGSKRLDDWKQMLLVFPDPDQPIEPRADMFARMGDAALGVVEIKLLSQINGELTPRGLVHVLGLPLHDIYQMLVRLAREGIIAPPGGDEVLHGLTMSVEESMQQAFAALDANDDKNNRKNLLDKVLGDEPPQAAASALDRALGTGGVGLGGIKGGAGKAADKFSALDKVFGGDVEKPADAGDAQLDQELLSIIKKSKRPPGEG